ncbi:hypothetical protein A1OS_05705 [Enterovibrio norvegicus]|nr:hypothetical protein A1OS_05705 [Enterovibrio norvegicus]
MIKNILLMSLLLSPAMASANMNVSYSGNILELGYSVDIKDDSYLYLGADSANWFAVGYGHAYMFENYVRLSGYYEYSQWDNVLLGDFGVRTNSHLIDLSVTKFFPASSIKFGGKYELIDDSGWEFEAGDKQALYTGYSRYFEKWYASATYTHSLRQYDDEMWGDSDSDYRSNELELTLGWNQVWKVSPYIKGTAFRMYGDNTGYSWSVGGSVSF